MHAWCSDEVLTVPYGLQYDAFGDIWTSFRELECKNPIFYGKEVRKTPNIS
jgi:hypothetical protein